jgi:putative two-component system response regulator
MRFQDIMINIFTSGKIRFYGKYKNDKLNDQNITDYLIRYVLMNFIHLFGSLICVLFFFQNIAKQSYFDAFACLILSFIAMSGFAISRTKIPLIIPSFTSMISFGLFCTMIIWNGDAQGAGFLFMFIYPPLTIILLGRLQGILFSATLFAIVLAEFFIPGLSRFSYHIDYSLRMAAVYMLILGIALVFETSRKAKDKLNEDLAKEILGMNENLQTLIHERTEKILKLQNSLLKTMSSLVEYRDLLTGEHEERTQHNVKVLIDEMKKHNMFAETMKDWNIDLILQSVQLHDIGKIAIDDMILKKPDALNKAEYEEMKKHALFGAKIIERIEIDSGESELLNHAKIIALTHHEKWDGTGYPNGLIGDEIPLQGRIMAIADVYDALISERPYKKPFTHEEAVRIIISGKGTQFDPDLVDLFIKTMDHFKRGK